MEEISAAVEEISQQFTRLSVEEISLPVEGISWVFVRVAVEKISKARSFGGDIINFTPPEKSDILAVWLK